MAYNNNCLCSLRFCGLVGFAWAQLGSSSGLYRAHFHVCGQLLVSCGLVVYGGLMWQAWVCAQGDWEGSVREGGGEQVLLRSRLELAHCCLCPILLAKACPKLA